MNAPLLITFGLLAISILAVWFHPIKVGRRFMPPWVVFFIASITSGTVSGYLTWQAICGLGIFGMTAYAAKKYDANRVARNLLLLLTGGMALALSMHRFPGFSNPDLVTMQLSPDALPFTHHANFDTTAAGLILLALFCNPVRGCAAWKEIFRRAYPIAFTTLLCVFSFAVILQYLAIDFKVVPYTAIYLITNLLFTCVTEEAFFRGFMQEQLTRAMSWRFGAYVAALVSAVLFGLAHARGGPVLILLATIAGMGYAYAYLSIRRVEASIFTHFALNAVHFVAFTYPTFNNPGNPS